MLENLFWNLQPNRLHDILKQKETHWFWKFNKNQ